MVQNEVRAVSFHKKTRAANGFQDFCGMASFSVVTFSGLQRSLMRLNQVEMKHEYFQ